MKVSGGASPTDEVHGTTCNDPGAEVADISAKGTEDNCDLSAATAVGHLVNTREPT